MTACATDTPDDDSAECSSCRGTGIGDPHSGTGCRACCGTGVRRDGGDDWEPPTDWEEE